MVMEVDSPYADLVRAEADALVKILESTNRKVLIVVVAVEADEVSMIRSVSTGTTSTEALYLLAGIQRQADAIATRIGGPRP